MKITFLIPPPINKKKVPERVFGCTYGLYPIPNIFILTFASILRNDGNQVLVFDAPIMQVSPKDFQDFLRNDKSDCYIFYTVNLAKDLDIFTARQIRAIRKDVSIIFCGPAPTYSPEEFLIDNATYVVRGEPDFTLRELVNYLNGSLQLTLKTLKGISFLDNFSPFHTPPRELIENLDALPFPARDLINRDLYYNPKLGLRPFTAVMTARGCPYRCKFCVPSSLTFARKLEYQRHSPTRPIPKVTFRSAQNVIAEFKLLKAEGYKAVSIIDDEFLLKKERVKTICEGIKDFGIRWGCLARADQLLDEELISAMSKAGCQYVDIGIESFDQTILDDVNKDLKVENFAQAVANLKKYKIEPKLNILIAASPFETKTTLKKTINSAIKMRPAVIMFNIANPFPGTEFYSLAKKNNWFVFGDYVPVDVQKESIIQYPHLRKSDIERIVRWANFRFYLSLPFIFVNIKRFLRPKELVAGLKSLLKKLYL
ncbi:MAG: radical SAM protein [candidate division WOR-3 bacterium]